MGDEAELVAKVREVIRAELVTQFDGGGWLKVDEFHPNWIELDGTLDVQELAKSVAAALQDPPCAGGRVHEWRRVASTSVWSEIRNTAAGVESWNRWRVVEVCNHCGNPRVLDEWTRDE